MSELRDFIKDKKNIISLLMLGIVALALPLIIDLVQKQQIFRSRAAGEIISFSGDNVHAKADGTKYFTLDADGKPKVKVTMVSPFGATPAATPISTAAPVSTAVPTTAPTAAPTPITGVTGNIPINPFYCGIDWHVPTSVPANTDVPITYLSHYWGNDRPPGVTDWLHDSHYVSVLLDDVCVGSPTSINSGAPGVHTLKYIFHAWNNGGPNSNPPYTGGSNQCYSGVDPRVVTNMSDHNNDILECTPRFQFISQP